MLQRVGSGVGAMFLFTVGGFGHRVDQVMGKVQESNATLVLLRNKIYAANEVLVTLSEEAQRQRCFSVAHLLMNVDAAICFFNIDWSMELTLAYSSPSQIGCSFNRE